MRRLPLCIALVATGLLAVAAPGTAAPGVSLRWDRCYGDAGVQFKDFACNTNAGVEHAIASFEMPADLPGVTGIEVEVCLGSQSATLPAWWRYFNAGTCRSQALLVSPFPPVGSTCSDWAQGAAAGGLAAYFVGDYDGPNHARVKLGFAVATPIDLTTGQEYFAFSLNFSHAKTVGTGACTGCLEPVVIYFSGMSVVPGTSQSVKLWDPANGENGRWVSWQSGYPTNVRQDCLMHFPGDQCLAFPVTFFDVVTSPPTVTRPSTWGSVKALYR